jgi:general secretion pathway protein F
MGQFDVTASDSNGKNVKIRVEAESVKAARMKARAQGLTPITVVASDGPAPDGAGSKVSVAGTNLSSPFGGIKSQDLTNMTRQLATLVKSHVPIVESLSALVDQIDNPKLRSVLVDIRQAVKEGRSLGDAFSAHPKHFTRVYINMVRAGESSGRLDVVLMRLAEFAENQEKLKGKIMGALTYPIIMVVVAFAVLGIIFVKVVPQITQIFVDMGAALPTPTKILIATSAFVQAWGLYLLIGLLVLGIAIERHVSTERGRKRKDTFLLGMPIFGQLVRKLAVARFARTLGTLLASGVPMLTALQITRNVVSNAIFEDAIERAGTQVSEGRSLAATLKTSGEFPPIVIHMVGVGEKSGELEGMLFNVAENYEGQVETSLGSLTSLLEPVMMIFMAVLVGFIVMAVLLPIMEMNQFA